MGCALSWNFEPSTDLNCLVSAVVKKQDMAFLEHLSYLDYAVAYVFFLSLPMRAARCRQAEGVHGGIGVNA